MTKSTMIGCLVLLALLNGCATAPTERISITPGEEAGLKSSPFLADAIDRKIERLETLLKENRIKETDEPLAVVIINAYQSAKSCLDKGLHTSCSGVNRDLLQGLSLIDERYFILSGNAAQPNAVFAPGSAAAPHETMPGGKDEAPQGTSGSVVSVEKPARGSSLEDTSRIHQENPQSLPDEARPGTDEQNAPPSGQSDEQQLQERLELISLKEKTVSHARQLVESEKFEEAIAAIDALGVEESGDPAASAILDEAISGIVNRERNRAAKAFYSARQTEDPARKESYLRTSHDILKQLIDKYPSSHLITKVKSNLDTVNSEMARFGLTP